MSHKDVLLKKDLLEKAATMKTFGYSPLGKTLKAQTDIAKKQYQGLDKVFISNKDNKNVNDSLIKKERNYSKSNLIYNGLCFYSNMMITNLIAFLVNQNIHIY